MSEFGAPGKIPPVLTGTAAHIPKIQEWDPEGDPQLPPDVGAEWYVPTIVRAPPQLPRPEFHPHRPEFPPRGVTAYFDTAAADHNSTQLGYTASSVQIDNFSNQWLWLPSCRRWLPPSSFGWILVIIPGTDVAEWHVQTPVGHAAGTVGTTASPVVTVWYEAALMPTTGVFITV